MSNPYWRRCRLCGKEFKSNSNGRVNCYECVPPNAGPGRPKANGRPSSVDMDKDKKELAALNESDADDEIRKVCEEADRVEHRARVAPSKFRISENSSGDRVVFAQRPRDGWGKCANFNDVTREEDCVRERFFESTPFCYDHLQKWRLLRAQRLAKKIANDGLGERLIAASVYDVKDVPGVLALLSKIGVWVERGWMTSSKADMLIKLAEAQVKALAHLREEKLASARASFLEARSKSLSSDPSGLESLTPEDLAEMEEAGKRRTGDAGS